MRTNIIGKWWRFGVALLITGVYLYVLRDFMQWHRLAFQVAHTWAYAHLFGFSMLAMIPMLLIIWGSRWLSAVGTVLVGVLIGTELLALVIQYYAREQIAQGVSIGLLVDNWPAIQPFLKWWELWVAPTALMILGLATGWAQRVIWRPLPRFLSTLALVGGVIGLGAVTQSRGYMPKLAGDPLLALLGAPQPAFTSAHIIAMAQRESAMLETYRPATPAPDRNVIIFMADSVKPDRLSQFGHNRTTMPVLDRLNDYFDDVQMAVGHATCGESICGTMSTLASRYFRDTPPYVATGLGQILQRHGYRTHLILAGDHRRFSYAHYGKFIEREATDLVDYRSSEHPLNSDRIVQEGLAALPPDDGTPRLIFVFFFSSHLSGEDESRFTPFGPHVTNKAQLRQKRDFTDVELVVMGVHYDNKLRQLDHYVADGLETLSAKGYLDNAIFSFISDHGEELGENGYFGHNNHRITEGLLRIPYVLAANNADLPDLSRVSPQQLDLAPTILDMLSVPVPSTWQGESLFAADPERTTFHEFGMRAVQRDRACFAAISRKIDTTLKFTECRTGLGTREYEFFDLKADPSEQNNLWSALSEGEQKQWRSMLNEAFDLE